MGIPWTKACVAHQVLYDDFMHWYFVNLQICTKETYLKDSWFHPGRQDWGFIFSEWEQRPGPVLPPCLKHRVAPLAWPRQRASTQLEGTTWVDWGKGCLVLLWLTVFEDPEKEVQLIWLGWRLIPIYGRDWNYSRPLVWFISIYTCIYTYIHMYLYIYIHMYLLRLEIICCFGLGRLLKNARNWFHVLHTFQTVDKPGWL